jgi:hypothetical protein
MHNLGDGIRSIVEWTKLLMGLCKALFLEVQLNFISHIKLVWHSVLIMEMLVLGIGIMKNILNLLTDVLDQVALSSFSLSMGQVFLGGHKGQCNIHGT